MKRYERPRMNVVNLEIVRMIVTSGDVTVDGGGEAEEGVLSHSGEWGNIMV